MAARWVLVLDPPTGGDPRREIGGLSLALRLALDAQAGGAEAIVDRSGEALAPALADSRLRLAVVDAVPDGSVVVRVAADCLVHRRLFVELSETLGPGTVERDLAKEPFEFDAPYAFSPFSVTDDEVARTAERALFRSLRKPEDGWTSRLLNRPISLTVSRLLVRTPLTPNQVSVGILAIGLGGAAFAAFGTYVHLVVGAVLFHAQSVLDGCDGEMSRVTHRGSLAGEWLDTIGDDLTNYGFFGAAGVGLYRTTGHVAYLVAALVVVGAGLFTSALEYRYLVKIGSGDLLEYPLSRATSEGGGFLGPLRPIFKRDTFVFLTLIAAVAGLVGPMLFVFAAGALGILVGVIGTEIRMARQGSR